jgi:DNA invertase Pin-like site-specific DNA recombinase
MMILGYARVSMPVAKRRGEAAVHDQNLALQKDALLSAGCEKICVDKMTGKSLNRPGLETTMEILRNGDTLVVWRLDRLGRSLKHLIELVSKLEEREIGFKSLTESIDTTSPSGKLVFHIFCALAEFERNLIIERTKAGLAAARARGRLGGRPPALNDKQTEALLLLYKEKRHSVKEICQIMGISRQTLYNYLEKANSPPKSFPTS